MRYTKIIKSYSSIGDMEAAKLRAFSKAEKLVGYYMSRGISAEIKCSGLYFFTYKVFVAHN